MFYACSEEVICTKEEICLFEPALRGDVKSKWLPSQKLENLENEARL